MKKFLFLPLLIVVFVGGFFVRTLFSVAVPACPLSSNPPPVAIVPAEPIVDSQSTVDYKKGYDAGLEKARLAVADMKCFQDTLQVNPHRLEGVVSSVTDSMIEIQMDASTLNPFLSGKVIKQVGVTKSTVIQRQVLKTDDVIQKEESDYKALTDKLQPVEPGKVDQSAWPEKPQKFSYQPLAISDLATEQRVVVETAADAISQQRFDATTITLYPSDTPTQANP